MLQPFKLFVLMLSKVSHHPSRPSLPSYLHCFALAAQVKKWGWADEISLVATSSRQSWHIQGCGVAGRSSPSLLAEHEAETASSTEKGRGDALLVWAHEEGKGLDLMARAAPSSGFYLCSFLSFLWRTGSSSPTTPNTATEALEEENSPLVN